MKTTVINISACPEDWRCDQRYAYVGRPGKGFTGEYGNPHKIGWCQQCGLLHDREDAIAAFRKEARLRYATIPGYRAKIERLRGRYLVCFCKPEACHADVYVELLEGA